MSSKWKLKLISVAEKLKVTEAVWTIQEDIAEKFGIPISKLSIILHHEGNAIQKLSAGNLDHKKRDLLDFLTY